LSVQGIERGVEIVGVEGLFLFWEILDGEVVVLLGDGSSDAVGEVVGEGGFQADHFLHLGDFYFVGAHFSHVEEFVGLVGTHSVSASQTESAGVQLADGTGIEALQVEVDLAAVAGLALEVGFSGFDVVINIQVVLANGSAIQSDFVLGEHQRGDIVNIGELEQLEFSLERLVFEEDHFVRLKKGFGSGGEFLVLVGVEDYGVLSISDQPNLH